MPLTPEQREQIEQTLIELNTEVNGICEAREDVRAALRLDALGSENIQALPVITNAKARAVGHAEALVALLSP